MTVFPNHRWFVLAICLSCLGSYTSALGQTAVPAAEANRVRTQPASRGTQAVVQQQLRSSYKPSNVFTNSPQPSDPQQQVTEQPARKALPLKPPRTEEATAGSTKRNTSTQSLTTVFGSLGIVLGLFFLFVWFSKRNSPRAGAGLPREAVEVLGRVPSGSKQQMELVRLGNKLVLLSITASATTALAEVTEPAEVERLTTLCREGRGGRVSSAMQALSRAST